MDQSQKTPDNTAVVTASVKGWRVLGAPWRGLKKIGRTWMIAPLLVIVIGLGVGGWLIYKSHHKPVSFSTKISTADSTMLSGNYQQVQKDLLAIQPKDTQEQLVVWSRLAAVNSVQGKYDVALMYYQKMLAKDPNNQTTLYNAADAAQRVGKKKVAAQYYQKSIDLLKKGKDSDPTYAGDLNDLKQKLKAMQ